MRRALIAIALSVMMAGGALAGPFEDAIAAANRRDFATSARLLRPLAEQGDRRAQFVLGSYYGGGLGVPQNDLEAARWLRLAANQGLAGAQGALGYLYAQGRGVPLDNIQAYMWFILAAERDNEARSVRDAMASRMTAAQIAEAQRRAREWNAAHPAAR